MSDEEPDDQTEDEGGVYVWTTNGGCAICDAMEGEYDDEPQRPHEFCECEITFVRNRPPSGCADDVSYELNDVSEALADQDNATFQPDDPVIITFHFTVTCYDGSTFDEEIEIETTYEEYRDERDSAGIGEPWLAEALEEIDTIAYSECAPCEPALVS